MKSEEHDINEARNLLRDYRAALVRCKCGSLLKEELTRLNLRMYNLGLAFPTNSVLSLRYHDVMKATSERKLQGGIYAHMEEAENLRRWIDFLSELVNPTPELMTVLPKVLIPPLC